MAVQEFENVGFPHVHALRPDGVVYLEAARLWSDDELAAVGLSAYRYLKAGAVHAHLLQRAPEAAA